MSDAGRSLRAGLVKPGAVQRGAQEKSRESIRPATRAPGGRIDEFECHRAFPHVHFLRGGDVGQVMALATICHMALA